jgi:hypothetical protein
MVNSVRRPIPWIIRRIRSSIVLISEGILVDVGRASRTLHLGLLCGFDQMMRWNGASAVSLFALAKQQGRHFRKVKKELDAAGIEPALDPKKVGATFYRRADLFNRSRQL